MINGILLEINVKYSVKNKNIRNNCNFIMGPCDQFKILSNQL